MQGELNEPRTVILETSTPIGHVAIARGPQLLGSRKLSSSRRHARDLVPALKELLEDVGWKPREVELVIVDRGPGSYTGLRVGIISAKVMAYAVRCRLVAVDAMEVLAHQVGEEATLVDVFVDAQQDRVYHQRFERRGRTMQPVAVIRIIPFTEWLAGDDRPDAVIGPGLKGKESRLPAGITVFPEECNLPQPEAVLAVGHRKWSQGMTADLWTLEPLYLRPSAAELQWEQ